VDTGEGRRGIAYALINYYCSEHGFEEQNLKGHGESVVEPLSNIELFNFHGCIVPNVSSLLPHPLGLFDTDNRPIGFGDSENNHH